jgi:hypothetical protein
MHLILGNDPACMNPSQTENRKTSLQIRSLIHLQEPDPVIISALDAPYVLGEAFLSLIRQGKSVLLYQFC